MPDPQILQLPADNWTDRKGQSICAIVVHGTGGTDSRATLQHGGGRGVSIHALITKTGLIYRMVPDERGANHAGAPTSTFTLNGHTYSGGAVNRATLGAELENTQTGHDPYPDAQLHALGWLIASWRSAHGPLPILRHADLDSTRRRDPYQLTTNTIEQWVIPPAPPLTKRYRARYHRITQRSEDNGPPYVRELVAGEIVEVDHWYSNSRVHLADGSGFADIADLEAQT